MALSGTDITLVWDPINARGDFAMAGADLAHGPAMALQTSVLVSLFTDRLASVDFVPTDGTANRRGWWGDSYRSRPIGSRLWQLERAKKTSKTDLLLKARDYCNEALAWLIEDGIAATVTAKTSWNTPDSMAIIVTITKPASSLAATFRYDWAWAGATS